MFGSHTTTHSLSQLAPTYGSSLSPRPVLTLRTRFENCSVIDASASPLGPSLAAIRLDSSARCSSCRGSVLLLGPDAEERSGREVVPLVLGVGNRTGCVVVLLVPPASAASTAADALSIALTLSIASASRTGVAATRGVSSGVSTRGVPVPPLRLLPLLPLNST